MKNVFVGFGVVCMMIILLVVGRACTTGTQIMDRTLDGDNVIFQYEWFKQQHEDYGAIKQKIDISNKSVETFKTDAGDRDKWTFEDKQEFSRLRSIADGLVYQMEDMRSKYNARSKMLNRNIFKDNNLPHQLN
jgi:hypothetical protein